MSGEVEWTRVDAIVGIIDGVAVNIYGLPGVSFRWEALLTLNKKSGIAGTLDAAKAAAVAAVRGTKEVSD